MEKINIAELLKDCPKGMELDCTMYDYIQFDYVLEENTYPIKIQTPEGQISLNKYGCYSNNKHAKCVIFPKGRTTWEGFQIPFNDGDVVFYDNCVSIFKEWGDATLFRNYVKVDISGVQIILCARTSSFGKGIKREARFATEEEKQKLFDAIKANGYKWNAETKTLEKLVEPMFKVGDRIQGYGTHINYPIRVVKSLEWDRYRLDNGCYIKFGDEHAYKLLKFDITTLKPFESKVLVRDINTDNWIGAFYSHYKSKKFYTIGSVYYYQCIPYEGNEHLLDTTNDCDDFYKTW